MRLLQITTIISAVLVDAAYVYNAPNLSVGLQSNHPVNGITNNVLQQEAYLAQDNRGEDKSVTYSNTYKDYGYLSTGNVPNYLTNKHQFTPNHNNLNTYTNLATGANNAGVITSHNFQTISGNHANNGYREYPQSWGPKSNLNTDFTNILTTPNAQNYQYQTWKPVNNVQQTTNIQSSPLLNKSNLNAGHAQSNQYPISHNNVRNTRVDLYNNVNYNSDFSNSLTSTAQNGVYNNGFITSQIKHDAPIDNPFDQMAITSFNTNYDQSGRLSAPFNNGYTHDTQSKSALNSVFTQSTQAVATDYNIKHDAVYEQRLTSINGNTNNNLVQNSLNPEQNQTPNRFNSLSAVTPIIHKHVYFHIPPPDIDEPQKLAPKPAPPKKDYKILFIKVPSQTSRLNLERLQHQMAQAAALQEKTLIYVLVKKQEEPEPVLLTSPKQSHHQVFFVKYNGDPFDIASQVNDEIDETGSIKSIVPLAPGLINGQS